MKKFILFTLIATLGLFLFACGEEKPSQETTPTSSSSEATTNESDDSPVMDAQAPEEQNMDYLRGHTQEEYDEMKARAERIAQELLDSGQAIEIVSIEIFSEDCPQGFETNYIRYDGERRISFYK